MIRFEKKEDIGLPDIVRELSQESMNYFNAIELGLEWNSWDKATKFKFVRLGEVLFIGSNIRYSIHDNNLMHMDVANQGFLMLNDEQKTAAGIYVRENRAMSHEKSLERYDEGGFNLVTDAGVASYIAEDRLFTIGGKSHDFSRTNNLHRSDTFEIASLVLAGQLEVTLEL